MNVDIFVIAQQPECYQLLIFYQHAFLSPALDGMCKDKD